MTDTINLGAKVSTPPRKLLGRSPEFYGVTALLGPLLQVSAFFLLLWAPQVDVVLFPFFALPVLTLTSGVLAVYAGRVFKKRKPVSMGLAGIAIEALLVVGMIVLLRGWMTDI